MAHSRSGRNVISSGGNDKDCAHSTISAVRKEVGMLIFDFFRHCESSLSLSLSIYIYAVHNVSTLHARPNNPASPSPHHTTLIKTTIMVLSSFFYLPLFALNTAAQSTNTTIRYMPFGDSITEIICWRAKLWQKLQSTPYANVDFVGSGKTENNCKDSVYDRDNEGHSGFLAIDIANKGQLDGWLKTNPADVVTMHLGTNDIVQQNKATADIIAAFGKLVASMRSSNPRMKIVVSVSLFKYIKFTPFSLFCLQYCVQMVSGCV
ncbi:hypothetical protein LEMA_P071890.1 [Plenodomus lingam JN3]|uniref:SGNH hydrolase-type esterase domain-containing protein n=1 Tax=Leptosphaeria maculans (strain JN3 / isolate v23.1.3 / race Av1-4-5-6-7-8) TaxID=985895 RepID=E4ZK86_LEPMJ|nr:hypothetical protein LEMA_P071890.1 [Plenodomus lingam JN3]CBX91681.1 hypothetical protein LEMA_P071890.1 [Plenodomus lingam JN3]